MAMANVLRRTQRPAPAVVNDRRHLQKPSWRGVLKSIRASRYTWIAIFMALVVAVLVPLWLTNVISRTPGLRLSVAGMFVLFWIVQTFDLERQAKRPSTPLPATPPIPAPATSAAPASPPPTSATPYQQGLPGRNGTGTSVRRCMPDGVRHPDGEADRRSRAKGERRERRAGRSSCRRRLERGSGRTAPALDHRRASHPGRRPCRRTPRQSRPPLRSSERLPETSVSLPGITLSDKGGQGERAHCRRSVCWWTSGDDARSARRSGRSGSLYDVTRSSQSRRRERGSSPLTGASSRG